jgi:hypothetical protein
MHGFGQVGYHGFASEYPYLSMHSCSTNFKLKSNICDFSASLAHNSYQCDQVICIPGVQDKLLAKSTQRSFTPLLTSHCRRIRYQTHLALTHQDQVLSMLLLFDSSLCSLPLCVTLHRICAQTRAPTASTLLVVYTYPSVRNYP